MLGTQASLAAELTRQLSQALASEFQAADRVLEISAAPSPSALTAPGGHAATNATDPVLTLLLSSPEAVDPTAHSAQRDQERRWRRLLDENGLGYQVLHGNGDQQLQQALSCIRQHTALRPTVQPHAASRPWVWLCEKCSDSACEHRLLSELLKNRQDDAGAPASSA